MAWVNGHGYQRACSYRHIAAVAEMSVAFSLDKARQAVVLVMSALTSRTAGYGPVCPVVWEGHPVRGVPIPIIPFISAVLFNLPYDTIKIDSDHISFMRTDIAIMGNKISAVSKFFYFCRNPRLVREKR